MTLVAQRQPCVQAFTRMVKVWKQGCVGQSWCMGYERRWVICPVTVALLMSHKRRIYPKGPIIRAIFKWDEMTRPDLLFPAPSSSVNHTFWTSHAGKWKVSPPCHWALRAASPGRLCSHTFLWESNASILGYLSASGGFSPGHSHAFSALFTPAKSKAALKVAQGHN